MRGQVFDELCIEFWRPECTGKYAEVAANLIISIGQLLTNNRVIDFGCGIGQIATELGKRGLIVTGIERSDHAFKEATRKPHVNCSFLHSDWSDFQTKGQFECAVFWRTTLCAGRDKDLQSLLVAHNSLLDGGRVIIESRNWSHDLRFFENSSERFCELGKLHETHTFNDKTGIQTTREHFETDSGEVVRSYETQRYSISELENLLELAGFSDLQAFDETGSVLNRKSKRLIMRAVKRGLA